MRGWLLTAVGLAAVGVVVVSLTFSGPVLRSPLREAAVSDGCAVSLLMLDELLDGDSPPGTGGRFPVAVARMRSGCSVEEQRRVTPFINAWLSGDS